MKRTTCPYLGLKDDPTTALSFPSPGNYCHQGRPVAPVKGAYQERYCLTSDHTACPVYQAAHPVPLPAAIADRSAPILNGRQIVAILGIPALVVAAAAIFYAWNMFGPRILFPGSIPETGPIMGSSNFQLLGGMAAPTLTPFMPVTAGSTSSTPTPRCPQPQNWVPYTVNPTDSLFRLSVIYGVTVEDLQKMNCMGSKTVIFPGQVIYVPFIPTSTPFSTDTLAPQIVQPANTQPLFAAPATATNTPAPLPSKTPTNTSPPPTSTPAPSNTPVPPTATTQPSSTLLPTNPPSPTATNSPPPTDTIAPPPPTATNPPPPTATNPPAPTATSQPPPPATIPPPPATSTSPPPPLPTATNPAPATATNPPPAATTNPPPAATATNPLPASTSPSSVTATTAPVIATQTP